MIEGGVIEFKDGLDGVVIEGCVTEGGLDEVVIGCGLVIASMFLYRPKKARSIKK